MSIKHYYVVIVGSGPAGLGVAEALKKDPTISSRTLILEKGNALDERICAVREGRKCTSCNPCNIMSGVGGAGPYTDGKICLYQQNLNELFLHTQSAENNNEAISNKIDEYLKKCKEIWLSHGAKDFKEIKTNEKMERLKTDALKHGINYICYPVLHIGSDGAREVINSYIKNLTDTGVKLETSANVVAVKRTNDGFEITYQNTFKEKEIRVVTSDFLVLSLGREMQKTTHLNQLLKDINLTFKPNNLEIGCRVEVPYQIMEEVTKITFDPKFIMIAPTYQDSVRTFCTCHRGKVVREGSCVNGHVDRSRLTQNTNFAILVRWRLDTFILDDAMDYGNTISKLTLSCGRGKPIIQRLSDLRKGIPSTNESIKKSHIKPTLRLNWLVEPGDIASCYPRRIIVDILEGLEKLDEVIKGINGDQNLLYAPEIKPACVIQLKEKGVNTEIPNLYVCGDFSGHTRGLAQAMCMGMMVGEDILKGTKSLQLRLI